MKKITMLVIAAIIILSAIGCAAPAPTAAPAAPAEDKTPIKLGWLGALSGDSATWGTADKNGVALTLKQINEAGGILGRPVEIVYYDGKGDQLEYINVLKRLIYEDKVVGVIGQNTSGNQIAMAPIAEEGKVPIISTFATNPKVTVPEEGKLMRYTFRVCFIDPYSGDVTAKFVSQDLGAKTAAVLFDISSDYSTGVKDFFVQAFEAIGGKIVAMEALKAGDVDFRPQLTKIKEANPDVIVMPLMFKEVALSANQARELGITTTLVGGDGWPSLQLLEIAGPAVEGSYYLDHADVNDPDLAEFRTAYEKEYNRNIEITAVMGHDALLLMKAAIEKAGKAEPEAIRDALETITDVKVLSGTINMDPATHNPKNKAAVIIKIEGGKFTFFKKFQPAE